MGSPHLTDAPAEVVRGLDAIRAEMEVRDAYPAEVEAAAGAAAAHGPRDLGPRDDRRELPLVTIDPPGSMDLDQALHIAPDGDGFTLHYAIADLAAFVPIGGVVEAEAWLRGQTVYLPDHRSPLYPTVISQGAASLLPGEERPAVLFTLPVSADGQAGAGTVRRATVRSTRRLAYSEVGDDTVEGLRPMGEALAAAATRRGATQVDLPDVEIRPDPGSPSGYVLEARERLPSEDWNAQVSLVANMVAARMMADAATGLFRVMDDPDPARMADLRVAAVALGFAVPASPDLAAVGTASGPPQAVGALRRTARASTGAGYRPFDPARPPYHAAVAAPYAHATAPIRRLADRYVLDLLVDLGSGATPEPAGAFRGLADAMNTSDTRASRAEAAALDLIEAFLLAPLVGRRFRAVVTGTGEKTARIQLVDPPVRASVRTDAPPAAGSAVQVTLVEADPARRRVAFDDLRPEG